MSDTMRAAVYYRNDDVRIEEVEKPRAGAGELLLETRASGICGSDVMEWYRVKNAPRVLGHEVTGVVTEVGEGVESFQARRSRLGHPSRAVQPLRAVPARRPYGLRDAQEHEFRPGWFRRVHPGARHQRGERRLPSARWGIRRCGRVHRAAGLRPARLAALADDAGPERPRGGKRHVRAFARAGGARPGGRPRFRDGRSSLSSRSRRAVRCARFASVWGYGGCFKGGERRPPGGSRHPVRGRAGGA